MSASRREPSFRYDAVAHRYRDAQGKFRSAAQVHGYVQEYSTNVGASLRALTQQLRDGSLSLAEWQLSMAQTVKDAHLAAAMAAKGGRAQMTQSDYGRVGQVLRQEYAYLGKLADGIANGTIPLDGRVLARAEQYGKAARETYENVNRRETQRRGADEERNIRGKTDSCDGCLAATAAGWVTIGTLSLPGTRTCLANCGCHIETRNSVTGQVFA